jgi:hypothetical protein
MAHKTNGIKTLFCKKNKQKSKTIYLVIHKTRRSNTKISYGPRSFYCTLHINSNTSNRFFFLQSEHRYLNENREIDGSLSIKIILNGK